MKPILLIITTLFIISGCGITENSDNFEKRKICYEDAIKKGGNTSEFVFYSPNFNACVQYFCVYQKMSPTEFDMKITPGCEILDFYTNKLYKAFTCAGKEECKNKIEKYK